MEGYADRPALAQRAYELVNDPQTGRTTPSCCPGSTITYGELADRVGQVSRALTDGLIAAGDRVCVLGFTSVDYTTIDLALGVAGAVSVPLQTSAAIAQLQPIVIETEPTVFAASIDYLADAVDVILAAAEAGHTPGRLVVFDYRSEIDDNREALQSAHERLADLALTIETLDDVARPRRRNCRATGHRGGDEDPLALLIYTSGSTGAPRARCTRRATSPRCGTGRPRTGSGPAPRRSP